MEGGHPEGVVMGEEQMSGLVVCKLFTPSKMVALFQVSQVTHDQAVVLQSALQSIPNPSSECMLRNVSIRLAQQISDEVSIKFFKALECLFILLTLY